MSKKKRVRTKRVDSLEETVSILANRTLTRKIRAGVREIADGRGIPLGIVAAKRSRH